MARLAVATIDIPRQTLDCVPSPEEMLRVGARHVRRLVATVLPADDRSRGSTSVSDHEWLSIREAARRLGVHENTIRNWIARGTLKFARLPGSGYRRLRNEDVSLLSTKMTSAFSDGLGQSLRDDSSGPNRGYYKGGGGQIKTNDD